MGRKLTQAQRKQINQEFFYRHIVRNTHIQSKTDARLCFTNLEEKYQNILTIRYGLDGGHKSASEDFLIEKSELENALELYNEAERALKNQIFAESLVDKDSFDLSFAIALGKLATDVIYFTSYKQVIPKSYNGKKLLDAFESINFRKREIVRALYGLDGLGQKTLEKVAAINPLQRERIRLIRIEVLDELRKKIKYFCV